MKKEAGFTLLEMLVVLGITTILSGMAVINLKKFDYASSNAAQRGVSIMECPIQKVRSKRYHLLFLESDRKLRSDPTDK